MNTTRRVAAALAVPAITLTSLASLAGPAQASGGNDGRVIRTGNCAGRS